MLITDKGNLKGKRLKINSKRGEKAKQHQPTGGRNEIYALVKVGREDLMITPELQARIDKAREEIKSGKCVTLKSSEDIDAYFDSL
ncbi:hypothetical protein NXV67_21305 (plasmid) [Bacteroides fragilis]|nr:hypothetical protein NXV67_21305 [Bacteroides fragilis]